MDWRQGFRVLEVGHCVANLKILKAHDSDNVASHYRFLRPFFSKALEGVKLFYLVLLHCAVTFHERHVHSGLQHTPFQAAHRDTAHV